MIRKEYWYSLWELGWLALISDFITFLNIFNMVCVPANQ